MIAVDTNVIVRYLMNDEASQAEQAERTLRNGPILVTRTVLLETDWVLRKAYGLDRAQVAAALRALLGLPGLTADDPPAVARALDWLESGLDFADALHLASSHPATEFATFDRRLARRARQLEAGPAVRSL